MKLPTISNIELIAPVEMQAADGDGPPTFKIHAYTGAAVQLDGYALPLVVDIAGMTIKQRNPILRDHDTKQVVGHSTEVKATQSDVFVFGQISGAGPAAQEVTLSAQNGFPWQASIGARPHKNGIVFIRQGRSATVNGRTIEGPID